GPRSVRDARRRRPRIQRLLLPPGDRGGSGAAGVPLPIPVRVPQLLGANALMLVTGVGVLPWLGVAHSWRMLWRRIGLAYFCGILVTAIVAAHLALVHVSFGWTGLSLLAALSAASFAWHLRGTERSSWRRPRAVTLAGVAALAALLAEYARA